MSDQTYDDDRARRLEAMLRSLAGRIGSHSLRGLALDEVGTAALDDLWRRGGFPRSFLAPGEAVAPGIVLLLGGVGLAVLGMALIVLVLRMLLAKAVDRDIEATRMRAELAEVI